MKEHFKCCGPPSPRQICCIRGMVEGGGAFWGKGGLLAHSENSQKENGSQHVPSACLAPKALDRESQLSGWPQGLRRRAA